jgi:hypothetical protein
MRVLDTSREQQRVAVTAPATAPAIMLARFLSNDDVGEEVNMADAGRLQKC